MPKSLSVFFCTSCGNETPKWVGRCPACEAWNTLREAPRLVRRSASRTGSPSAATTDPVRLGDVVVGAEDRMRTGIDPFDELLGGGLVRGSVTLLAGEPGVGKSTLALAIVDAIARRAPVLYCCAEESASQTKLRAARLGASDAILLVASTDVERVVEAAAASRPALLVVDSIQAVRIGSAEGTAGSVGQVRECAAELARFAKESGVAVLLVGHVTKDGTIAGPKVLEHLVDTVLSFEGERAGAHRALRATKHRFGATDGLCLFAMDPRGLTQVGDASRFLLRERPANAAGSVVAAALQGNRPCLIEVQALVADAGFGTPRRLASGVDHNRLCMIVAVLERRAGLRLAAHDVFASVVGGLRIAEPAIDLALALAIASAFRDRPMPDDIVCFGEIGLAGEVRSVTGTAARLGEAAKLGFRRAIVPPIGDGSTADGIQVIPVKSLADALLYRTET